MCIPSCLCFSFLISRFVFTRRRAIYRDTARTDIKHLCASETSSPACDAWSTLTRGRQTSVILATKHRALFDSAPPSRPPVYPFPPMPNAGRFTGFLREGRVEDPVGTRHPVRDGHAPGVRDPPEGGRAPKRTGGRQERERFGEHGHWRHRGRNGFPRDEPNGYDQDANDGIS